MNIYISGISGTGMGPLALMAKDAGHNVFGSDLAKGPVAEELLAKDIPCLFGPQDGQFLQKINDQYNIDWLIYTSALSKDHAELQLAQKLGIKTGKRDQLIAKLVSDLGLKMVAVAGTHGKTTTTAMLIWACQELGLPASYLVGTTLPFAPAGKYTPGDIFFIYEADEYDRNFLAFHPWLSLITTVSYDHPDIYKTPEDYQSAFRQFESQSDHVLKNVPTDPRLTLAGALRREDASLALKALKYMLDEIDTSDKNDPSSGVALCSSHPSDSTSFPMAHCAAHERAIAAEPRNDGREDRGDMGNDDAIARIVNALNAFPGAGRRFERLAPGIYSDYAHHPEEISATIKMALEEARNENLKGVVTLYQPHQNTRQHQVRSGYKDAFNGISKLFWLPTYLTREDESLSVITPEEFIASLEIADDTSPLDGSKIAESAELDDSLARKLISARDDGFLVLLLTAGPADSWFRHLFLDVQ